MGYLVKKKIQTPTHNVENTLQIHMQVSFLKHFFPQAMFCCASTKKHAVCRQLHAILCVKMHSLIVPFCFFEPVKEMKTLDVSNRHCDVLRLAKRLVFAPCD